MSTPTNSVVIPAFNEEKFLHDTWQHLQRAMATIEEPGEVIIVDNNSTDRTGEIARDLGAHVVFEPVNQIARARNAGARQARGEFLVFLDADTRLPADLLRKALARLAAGDCVGGGGQFSFESMTRPGARPLLKFFNWLMRTFKLAAGCFVYCLRTAYDETGGFDEKVYASEEIWFSRALRRWGKPRGLTFDIILDPPVVTSSRKLDYPGSLVLAIIVAVFFPFALYFRPLCWLWYKRMPRKSEHF